jgi:hypothetical protein
MQAEPFEQPELSTQGRAQLLPTQNSGSQAMVAPMLQLPLPSQAPAALAVCESTQTAGAHSAPSAAFWQMSPPPLGPSSLPPSPGRVLAVVSGRPASSGPDLDL